MIDVGIITGSGIYRLAGDTEPYQVETRFGEAEVAVTEVGPWTVGSISRHGAGHHHLPHTVAHQAHLAALEQLKARAVLATTAVSQTCGPEVVLAGELELPYALVGFPVNYATGVAEPESEQELSRLLTLSAKTLTKLVLRTVEVLEEQDLVYDHG